MRLSKLLHAAMFAATTSGLIAQDYSVTVTFEGNVTGGDFTMKDAQNEESGNVEGPIATEYWSWIRNNDDFEVYNEDGILVFTVQDFFNGGPTSGEVIDNPNHPGDYTGTWQR